MSLSKFSNSYLLSIKCLWKDVYLDDYEEGELDGYSMSFDIDNTIKLKGNENKEQLTNIVVDFLRDKMYNDDIQNKWIAIVDNRISLFLNEDEDGCYIDSNEVKRRWNNGEKVYACYYDFALSINGQRLEENDLIELFDFDY